MQYKDLLKRIESNPDCRCYIFHGAEEYVKERFIAMLADDYMREYGELNYQAMEAGTCDGIMSCCETLPFFAEKRLLVCKTIPTGDEGKRFADYIPDIPPSTLLIFFVRGKADERSAVFKTVSSRKGIIDFGQMSEATAADWVSAQAAENGTVISPRDAAFLVRSVGVDAMTLYNELKKAADYAGSGNPVTSEIINRVVSKNIEYKAFDMLGYFIAGNSADGFRALSAMIQDRESPFQIAGFMEGRFRLMLMARLLIDKKIQKDRAVSLMGGNVYAAKAAYDGAKKFTRKQLEDAVRDFADVGYMQMSGRMKDRDALELALFRLSDTVKKL